MFKGTMPEAHFKVGEKKHGKSDIRKKTGKACLERVVAMFRRLEKSCTPVGSCFGASLICADAPKTQPNITIFGGIKFLSDLPSERFD